MSLDVSNVLERLAARCTKKVMYRGRQISLQQTFALNGALPILVKRANLLHDFLFGSKLQVTLKSEPSALTGDVVVISPTQPLFILVMMLYDVFEEMLVNAGKGDIVLN